MAQWQRITPNFTGANGALAVASNAFAKAGGLSAQLANSIRQRDTAEAQKAALLNSSINDSRKTDYLLDTENRQVALEQYQNDLNKFRTNEQNQQVVQAEQNAMPEAKDKLRAKFAQTLTDKYGAPVDPNTLAQAEQATGRQVGEFGPARPAVVPTDGQTLTPAQVSQNSKLEQQFQEVMGPEAKRQQALAQWDKVDPAVDRKTLYNTTLEKLMAQNTGLPLETLQAKAQAYVNQSLGALPDADTIKSQNEMTDKIYAEQSNTLREAMKRLLGKDGKSTAINISTGNGRSGVSRNSNGQSISFDNDPEAFNEWLSGQFKERNSLKDVVLNLGGKTQSVNQQDIKDAYLFYKTKFGITDNQFMSYINGAIKEGLFSADYGPESLFPKDPNSKPNKDQAKIAQDMQKMGADKTSMTARGFGPNGAITDPKAAKALLGEKYNQYKKLFETQQQLTKEYMSSRSAINKSKYGKTGDQIVQDFMRTYVEPISAQVDSKLVKMAPKQSDIGKTKLFTDKANPIAAAMLTTDPKGESSLHTLITSDPEGYAKSFKLLSKPEQAAVVKYLNSPKFKSLVKSNTKKTGSSNTAPNITDTTKASVAHTNKLISQNSPSISVRDLGDSYDILTLRKNGYVPEYNNTREIVGWRNPRLEQQAAEATRKSQLAALKNRVNPSGANKPRIVMPDLGLTSGPTADSTYQYNLLHR
jgi:hypothetical protein